MDGDTVLEVVVVQEDLLEEGLELGLVLFVGQGEGVFGGLLFEGVGFLPIVYLPQLRFT